MSLTSWLCFPLRHLNEAGEQHRRKGCEAPELGGTVTNPSAGGWEGAENLRRKGRGTKLRVMLEAAFPLKVCAQLEAHAERLSSLKTPLEVSSY